MAHAQSEPDSHPHRFLNGVVLLILVGMVAALGAVVAGAPTKPHVDESSFRTAVTVDEKRLYDERDEKYGLIDLSKNAAQVKDLQDAVRASHELQFGSPAPSATRDAMMVNVFAANEVLAATNLQGVMLAGNEVFEECRKGLDEVREALKSDELPLEKAKTDPGEEFARYRKNCGNALPTLLEVKLLKPDGSWVNPDVGPVIFDILNRYRWGSILDLRLPPEQQLTHYEYELLTKWRLANDAFPVQKRIEWAQVAARELPSLPLQEILGNLHFEAGDVAQASAAYHQACEKEKRNLELQAKCEWLAARTASTPSASGGH